MIAMNLKPRMIHFLLHEDGERILLVACSEITQVHTIHT